MLASRLSAYIEKALREAKLHTSWLNPDREYEEAVQSFLKAILADRNSQFLTDLNQFVASIADAGFVNSLAQLLIKICAPGVPDFYQGVEFWDFNLVDPDNRRPVDFDRRRQVLERLIGRSREDLSAVAADLLSRWPDDALKMFVTWRGLECRRQHAEIFAGSYQPLKTSGPREANACAFARSGNGQWALCVVPRLAAEAWQATDAAAPPDSASQNGSPWQPARWWESTALELPGDAPRRWRHVFSDRVFTAEPRGAILTLDLAELFASFPVALLLSETS